MVKARTTAVLVAATIALAASAAGAAAAPVDHLLAPETVCPDQRDQSRSAEEQEQTMLCMIRYARRETNRHKVSSVKALRASSRGKDDDIKRCQDFSHTACGRDAFYWPRRTGYMKGIYGVGENLAYGNGYYGCARSIMHAWLHSP